MRPKNEEKDIRFYQRVHPNQSRKSYRSGDSERHELRGVHRI